MEKASTRFLPVLVRFLPLFERFLPILSRSFRVFERFVPVFVSFVLKRILRAWKTEGLIDDYETRTLRIGKFHYKIDVSIILTTEQVTIVLNYLGKEVLRRLKI
jgi:hypothetical protein